MNRRRLLATTLAAALPPIAVAPARAHHGWGSFDGSRPIYLEGTAAAVQWRNPHASLDLDVAPAMKLPSDLGSRTPPRQTARFDGAALLRAAQLPSRQDRRWHIELAPLTRMQAWAVPEIKPGDRVAVLGFTFPGEQGDAVLRVEYLFLGSSIYGLRSSPAS